MASAVTKRAELSVVIVTWLHRDMVTRFSFDCDLCIQPHRRETWQRTTINSSLPASRLGSSWSGFDRSWMNTTVPSSCIVRRLSPATVGAGNCIPPYPPPHLFRLPLTSSLVTSCLCQVPALDPAHGAGRRRGGVALSRLELKDKCKMLQGDFIQKPVLTTETIDKGAIFCVGVMWLERSLINIDRKAPAILKSEPWVAIETVDSLQIGGVRDIAEHAKVSSHSHAHSGLSATFRQAASLWNLITLLPPFNVFLRMRMYQPTSDTYHKNVIQHVVDPLRLDVRVVVRCTLTMWDPSWTGPWTNDICGNTGLPYVDDNRVITAADCSLVLGVSEWMCGGSPRLTCFPHVPLIGLCVARSCDKAGFAMRQDSGKSLGRLGEGALTDLDTKKHRRCTKEEKEEANDC
ncbi:hypothetical protein C0Q70_17122 [Pomacea canaliculata]|uniref:Uncharacterized protein n=1 Tax=Pomacea canaliculata TaxID=400727 RepID=A0A2T7NRR9_POMCA|nr:hypothetical protein C0Q70_17122 [Pomacea canaliculata]